MTENNAAQPGLTDEEIQDIADGFDIYGAKPEFARAIESALLSKLRAEGVQAGEPVADERCKRCGGPGWYTSHTTGYPHSMPCSACNPRGLSAERLAKDPFLAAQLWRKPADGAEALLGRILEHVSEYGESMASSTLLSVRSIARRNVETRIAAELAALASAPVAKPKRAPLDDWRVQAIAECLETEWDDMTPASAEADARLIVGYLIAYEKESDEIEARHDAEPVEPIVQAIRNLRASAPVVGESVCKGSMALGSGCGACERCKAELQTASAPVAVLSDADIREVFLAHGFTIKDGQADLKPYVYEAARALIAVARIAADADKALGVYAARESAPVANAMPIRLSTDVLEYLKEGIENATGCDDSDVDHDFANELERLMTGPLYTKPLANYPEVEWAPMVVAPVAGEAQITDDDVLDILAEYGEHHTEHGRIVFDKWTLQAAGEALLQRCRAGKDGENGK